MRIAVSIACAALLCIACAEESTSKDRSSVNNQPTSDGGTGDAGGDAGVADPEDGRDEDPASCYAACSNTTFTCSSNVVATLAPEQTGCTGTVGPAGGATKTLKLDCGAKKVCIDGTCIDGKFSAFTFAYTQAGATEVICTRD